MSLSLMQKNLTHAHQVLSNGLVSLRTSNKPSQIALTINGATAAATADLRAAPKQSVAVITDLADARIVLDTVNKRLTSLAKVVTARKIAFADYRKECNSLSAMLEGVELQLTNARNLIVKAETVRDGVAPTESLTTPAFLAALISTDSKVELKALTKRWFAGLPRAEADQYARRRGPLVDQLLSYTDSNTARLVLETVSSLLLTSADQAAQRQDTESVVRAAQAVELTRKLEREYGPKLSTLNVQPNGIKQIRLPLRVTFAHRNIRPDTLAKNGMKAVPFSYEKFNNGTFIVEDQALIVMRRSDAEAFHRESQNDARRSNNDIKMLKNLKANLKKVDTEIAELTAASATQKSQRARVAIADQLADLRKRSDELQKSITTVQEGAETAKKLISNKHKQAKKSSDEMVREYADHILDLANSKLSVEYAKVSGKLLHKVKNVDYVYMWIAPKHYVRALHALSGGNGDLVTSWTLAWA